MTYEQVTLRCKICGKKISFIKRKDITAESLICQKCGKEFN